MFDMGNAEMTRRQIDYCISGQQTVDQCMVSRLTSIISTSSASFLALGFFFRSFLSRIARLRRSTPKSDRDYITQMIATYLSLSSLMVTITTLLGFTPIGAVAPFDLSR